MVIYENDAAGRVTSMTYPDNQVVSYGYGSSNAVTSVDVRQNLSSSAQSVADYVYDNMGRVTDVLLGDNSLTTYQYDDIGRLERHTLADFHITTLGYNPANQIIRRSVTDSTMHAAMPSSAPDLYTPNNLNQYTFVDTNNPLYYDDNGNLTDYDGWDYGYDAHNRLESATRPGTSLSLAYDPTGRLSSTTLQGSTTSFSYSGDQLIGEYNSSGNQTNLYVYAPGSDIPIARFSGGSIGPNNVTYLRADERGSIVLETDGTTVLESHQYDVYGVPLNVSDSLFRYTGQIQLKGTELYHYKARAYHPELGRFLQTDPIGYDDGMNMYAYVGNDPVNLRDPTGKAACAGLCIGAAVIVYRGYTAYKAYKALKRVSQAAAVAQAINESADGTSDSPDLPDELVGDQSDSRAGSNRKGDTHTSGKLLPEKGGKGDYKEDLKTLAGPTREAGKGDKAPPGSQIGENGVFGREVNSNGGSSIEIPAKGDKPREVLHYEKDKFK